MLFSELPQRQLPHHDTYCSLIMIKLSTTGIVTCYSTPSSSSPTSPTALPTDPYRPTQTCHLVSQRIHVCILQMAFDTINHRSCLLDLSENVLAVRAVLSSLHRVGEDHRAGCLATRFVAGRNDGPAAGTEVAGDNTHCDAWMIVDSASSFWFFLEDVPISSRERRTAIL